MRFSDWSSDVCSYDLMNDTTKRIGEPGSYTAYEAPWAYASNTPFRKYKKYMHEGGIATPSVWYWPQGIKQPGGFTDGVGHIIDLMPTLRELSGADADSRLPGISLVPLLRQNRISASPEASSLDGENEGNRAIRDRKSNHVTSNHY